MHAKNNCIPWMDGNSFIDVYCLKYWTCLQVQIPHLPQLFAPAKHDIQREMGKNNWKLTEVDKVFDKVARSRHFWVAAGELFTCEQLRVWHLQGKEQDPYHVDCFSFPFTGRSPFWLILVLTGKPIVQAWWFSTRAHTFLSFVPIRNIQALGPFAKKEAAYWERSLAPLHHFC